jgi:hypothetical protein
MRHLRPYLAWFLLVATMVIALPRTWIHDCTDVEGEHIVHDMGASDDQITHEDCPFCDYAPASPLQPTLVVAGLPPTPFAAILAAAYEAFSAPQVRLTELRGPPMA